MNRERLTILIVALFLIMAFLLFLSFLSNSKQATQPTKPLPTPTIVEVLPKQDRISISGIEVNNFLKFPISTNTQGDIGIVYNKDYQIDYAKQFQIFYINIKSSSGDVRQKAESDFLNQLGITKEQACKLNVSVSSPYVPNPELTLPKRSMSFCTNEK